MQRHLKKMNRGTVYSDVRLILCDPTQSRKPLHGYRVTRIYHSSVECSFVSNASMLIFHFLGLVAFLQQCSASTDRDRPWLAGIPTAFPLLSKEFVSDDTDLYHFGLPNRSQSLGISTCSCILVSPLDSDLTRPYTPISSRHEKGQFTLLVKRYPLGAMSTIFNNLQAGRDMLSFRQVPFNLKIQYPFDNPNIILMLAAGTGITPMYQVRRVLFYSNISMECPFFLAVLR